MIPAHQALRRLREGNDRFVSDDRTFRTTVSPARRAALVGSQSPFAVIFGCSDSRVPAEIVFDQGLGDLFVIRVAGNVVAPTLIGSVEFAAGKFDTRLVVVLGHTGCGAVEATLEEMRKSTETQSPNLRAIVDRVRPAIEDLLETELRDRPVELERAAVRANIHASVEQLRHGSKLLEQLIQGEGLRIVGAEYSLETGKVEFFDEIEEPA